MAIWSNLTDQTLTEERTLSNWSLISIDLEGTKPSFISTENVYTTSSNLVYTGGEMYRYWGSGATFQDFQYRFLDFVENDTNGDFAFIGNDARCDANGNGVLTVMMVFVDSNNLFSREVHFLEQQRIFL